MTAQFEGHCQVLNPSSGSEQTVVVTTRAMGETCCQTSSVISTVGRDTLRLQSVSILKVENNLFGER